MKAINGGVGKILLYIQLILEWFSPNHTVRNVFDYHSVMKHRRDLYWNGIFPFSGYLYGYTPSLRYSLGKYSGKNDFFFCAAEHGVFFRNYNRDLEDYQNRYPVILVPSIERVRILRKHTNRCIIPIGPDIQYADPVLDLRSIEQIKSRLGKTLLAFPSHNTLDIDYDFAHEEFIKYVERIKKQHNYDTILVCLYCIDIERGEDYFYKKRGWRIVSAGYPDSYDFKSILKTLIVLSDHVINQGFGSNVGWSLYLGKPVTIFSQKGFSVRDKTGKITYYNKTYGSLFDDKVEEMLKEYEETISEEQWRYFSYHYGYDCIRSPEEIRLILEFSKEAYFKHLNNERMKKLASKKKYRRIKKLLIDGLG